MKKNILAILILAATLVNLTLTAVSLFVVVPANAKTNNLITRIVAMLDMEVENQIIKSGESENVPISASVPILLEEDLIITLKQAEGETKRHYLQVRMSVALNGKAKDFKDVETLVNAHLDRVKEVTVNICAGYTSVNVMDSKEEIKQKVIKELQRIFESQTIYDVTFSFFNFE